MKNRFRILAMVTVVGLMIQLSAPLPLNGQTPRPAAPPAGAPFEGGNLVHVGVVAFEFVGMLAAERGDGEETETSQTVVEGDQAFCLFLLPCENSIAEVRSKKYLQKRIYTGCLLETSTKSSILERLRSRKRLRAKLARKRNR